MQTHLLLEIIQKGVEELKQIADNFKTETPNLQEIEITTLKTETILKELRLLQRNIKDFDLQNRENENKDTTISLKNKKDNVQTELINQTAKTAQKIFTDTSEINEDICYEEKSTNSSAKTQKVERASFPSYTTTKRNMNSPLGKNENNATNIKKEYKVIGETISASKDLKELININDRFQFISELFQNNNSLYNETIDKLNSVSSFENAKKIISSFSWNEENETVAHFIEILTRKFNDNV